MQAYAPSEHMEKIFSVSGSTNNYVCVFCVFIILIPAALHTVLSTRLALFSTAPTAAAVFCSIHSDSISIAAILLMFALHRRLH